MIDRSIHGSPGRLTSRNLSLAHILLSGIGLVFIAYPFYYSIGPMLFPLYRVALNDWALPFYFPEKRNELFAYVAIVCTLFVYYVIACFVVYKKDRVSRHFFETILSNTRLIFLYAAAILLVDLIPAFIGSTRLAGGVRVVPAFAWLITFLLPLFPTMLKQEDKLNCLVDTFRPAYWILIALSAAQLIAMFYPFISGQIKMINEFWDIPEQTLLRSGSYVDNTEYINRRGLLVPLKYDVEKESVSYSDMAAMYIPRSKELSNFIQANGLKYGYDDTRQTLLVSGVMSSAEYSYLRNLMTNDSQRADVDKLYYLSQSYGPLYGRKDYSIEDRDFFEKNGMEITWQTFGRWVLHHHNFVLGPINEYALGKPLDRIYAQYGLLSVVVVKTLLEKLGGISYQNYFRVWFSFYVIYYMLFLGMLFFIFRKSEYVMIAFALAIGVLSCTGYRILFLGPGMNPIRHFFDVLVICSFYAYVNKRSFLLLMITSLLAVLGVLNNAQMGIPCLAALLAAHAMLCFSRPTRNRWPHLLVLAAVFVAGVFLCFFVKTSFDPVIGYYLSGLSGFPLPRLWLLIALLGSCLVYFTLFKWLAADDSPMKYIATLLTFYSQTLFLYCVWGGTVNHILNLLPIFLLTVVAVFSLLVRNSNRLKGSILLIVSVCTIFFILSSTYYYLDRHFYYNVFAQHKTFRWDTKTAQFESTMDPKYFSNAVNLIRKYTHGENGIYILSKYDYFLPLLAEKYSAMPFFDLQWFLLTTKETQLCIDRIKEAKPKHLFVDTNIERPLSYEIINKYDQRWGSLHEESLMRIGRLEEIKKVYRAVKEAYEPLEKGYLITVYVRKDI